MSTLYSITITLIAATAIYCLYGAIHRLYLSPLAKFPGCGLAALTSWYEFHYDVIKRGTYMWEIERMHEVYGSSTCRGRAVHMLKRRTGPIIRINPYELHISDPAFAEKLYPLSTKNVEKWGPTIRFLGGHDSAFSTVEHQLHRQRRAAFSSFFSKASVRKLEPLIQSLVRKLCQKLQGKVNTGEPVSSAVFLKQLPMAARSQ